MNGLPTQAKLYWTLVVSAGVTAVVIAAAHLAGAISSMSLGVRISIVVLVAIAVMAERMEVPLTTFDDESARHSIGSVACIAAIVVLPWYAAILVAGLSVAMDGLRGDRIRTIFNSSNMALSVAAAAAAFAVLGGSKTLQAHSWLVGLHAFGIMAIIAATYYVAVSALMVLMVALASHQKPIQVFKTVNSKMVLQETTTIGLGLMLGGFWLFNPAFTPLVALPVVMAYFSIETFVRIQQETRQAVLEMAKSIDLRDPATRLHSQRVAKLSVALAREIDLSREQVATIELSGLVHDIGKIGIPSEILTKPGRLTDEERSQMEAHPVIGWEMLRHYKQFRKGLEIVRSHHERWDGNGYPDRIPASQLSVETRIVCIADAYEAMTADRYYRKAMSSSIAFGRLVDCAGTQFDPDLVPKFRAALVSCGELDAQANALDSELVAAPIPVVNLPPAVVAEPAPEQTGIAAQIHSIRPLYRPRMRTLKRVPAANTRCRSPLAVGNGEGGI